MLRSGTRRRFWPPRFRVRVAVDLDSVPGRSDKRFARSAYATAAGERTDEDIGLIEEGDQQVLLTTVI